MPAPEPQCGEAGWTVSAAALYLKSYSSVGSGLNPVFDTEGDWDWGFRGSVGYERPDGLFFRVIGFWWEGALEAEGIDADLAEIQAYTIDAVIGDTFCPTQNTTVEVSAGVRYGKGEYDYGENLAGFDYEFDGWGPTFQIRLRRSLTDTIALYADFQQSFLFGEADVTFNNSSNSAFEGGLDTLSSISEIRGGIEFGWGWNAIQNAYLRLGGEGQYWAVDALEIGLVGGMAEVGFHF